MGFQIDPVSEKHLIGVHPDLVKVVHDCADNYSAGQFFGVTQGLRTLAEQEADVKTGKSTTMRSRHLDGHAVDLSALVMKNGGLVIAWDWPLYYAIAEQMKAASIRTGVPLNWGGCWDRKLADLGDDMEHESALYVLRARQAGGRGFLDGPHMQLPWVEYPSRA